ncbi:DUF5938 domain-containing protein [Streptomyces caniscabiei]|nr:DUF5938 domain-containing protein [Streptomyces caniscabiei]MDX3726047.1 DUF5938 domain-containing protein [Streptomyces caniscabiei]
MSNSKPVVVYGASGYTGRLVCEYLREYNIPFIAAGRDKARIQDVLDKVPGIDTVDHEVVEVEHAVGPLTELFRGAKVVSNMVGPFIKYGPEVVQAALAAGCHYLDTTGEQDWALDAQARWGDAYAEKGLLLSPGIAQMYTTGEIAANICLETPGLDTLDVLVLWKGFPTYASTQTIFTILKADWHYLEENQYRRWDPLTAVDVAVPGQHETALALPWGGTLHPVWFKNDPRVATCKVLGGVMDRGVMQGVVETVKMVESQIKTLPAEQQDAAPHRGGRLGAGRHAAPGEPARQHLHRLRPRLGPAGARPLRDPRPQQLQADRTAPGVRRVLPAPAAAPARRRGLRVPGVRPP